MLLGWCDVCLFTTGMRTSICLSLALRWPARPDRSLLRVKVASRLHSRLPSILALPQRSVPSNIHSRQLQDDKRNVIKSIYSSTTLRRPLSTLVDIRETRGYLPNSRALTLTRGQNSFPFQLGVGGWVGLSTVLFLAVLDPRVGHTMDVLSPFIFVLCHSDWLFHRESCSHRDVVHPGRAWSSSPTCTWHRFLHYLSTKPAESCPVLSPQRHLSGWLHIKTICSRVVAHLSTNRAPRRVTSLNGPKSLT